MTQYVINIGTIPNDGTGDPLRTAFNEVNLNFDQVFAAGPVLSNIQIANNTILTTNTNGNLILAPNGIGVVQANVSIVPNTANIRNLGAADRRWSTIYLQYANISGGLTVANLTATGDVVVGGNLSITGNVINIGNIITDAKTIQLANTAASANAANGSGITVGANDNIATFLFSSTANAWTTNVGISVTGNITGNIVAADGNTSVQINRQGLLGAAAGFNYDYAANILYAPTGSFQGFAGQGTDAILVGVPGTPLGSNVTVQITSNVDNYSQINQQNISTGNSASADYIITADNGTDSTYYVDLGLAGSNHVDPDFFGDTGTANDGYLYVTANDQAGPGNNNVGNLIIGSTNGVIKMFVGNTAQANVIQTVTTSGVITAGNILPAASNTYSLGNSTLWWSNIWVAGNTIYIGGVALGMGAGNVLTVGGNAVLQNDSNTSIATTGNITANNIAITGGRLDWANASIVQTSASDFSITGDGQVTVRSLDGTYQWTFDNAGNLTAPGNIGTSANVSANYFLGNGSQLTGLSTSSISNGTSNVDIPTANGNVTITANSTQTWTFATDGTTFYPTLTVTRGDRTGTLTGQTLLFGDSTQEAIISTSNGTSDINSSQRLVINPGAGYAGTTGEGGDIYLYAGRGGDAGGSGGDIKIRGGLGPVNGDGGYIDIIGGEADANGVGGRIDIQGGQSGNATGGNINITGGQGATTGGYINIQGGTGTAGPGGNLTLQGGVSSNGLAEYGNVIVNSGASQWQFNNTGNISLPQGGIIAEQPNPGGFPGYSTVIQPTGYINPNQKLLVYPTGGEDYNHLHLTTGNLYNTELFLGNDDLYVKLSNTGNIQLQVNDNVGNLQQWTFGTDGVLNLPYEGILQSTDDTVTLRTFNTTTGNANSVYLGTSGGLGFFDQEIGANWLEIFRSGTDPQIATTGNLLIRTDSTNTAPTWTFGANGTLTAPGNISAGNFVGAGSNVDIVAGSYDWTFVNDGNLVLPGNSFAVKYANGTAVSLGGSYGNADVANLLATFGSNSISTTGNVTAANFVGNISLIGNVTGTTANVTLVAGVYSTVFDNTGLATFPGSLITPPVPLANLTAVAGARAFVNNANLVATGNFGSQISGGGANTVPVWSDGSNWYIG